MPFPELYWLAFVIKAIAHALVAWCLRKKFEISACRKTASNAGHAPELIPCNVEAKSQVPENFSMMGAIELAALRSRIY